MADLVIGHLQGYASTMQSHPRITANPETAALTDKLPLLLEGNWVHNQTACILEEDFPKLATHNKVSQLTGPLHCFDVVLTP